jgi:hypothetical protein
MYQLMDERINVIYSIFVDVYTCTCVYVHNNFKMNQFHYRYQLMFVLNVSHYL